MISSYKIIKRDGTIVSYDKTKIENALIKAFNASYNSYRDYNFDKTIKLLVKSIENRLLAKFKNTDKFHIEQIQDEVEFALMKNEQKVARQYIIYREKRAELRKLVLNDMKDDFFIKVNEQSKKLSKEDLIKKLNSACDGLENIDSSLILKEAIKTLFNNMTLKDFNNGIILATKSFIELEPNYSFVCARFLLDLITEEAQDILGFKETTHKQIIKKTYKENFANYIKIAISKGILNPEMANFDLEKLSENLKPLRDMQFNYLGLQSLYDRYLIKDGKQIYELPQYFFMRVAMGVSLKETNREQKTIEFYNMLSSFDFMASTPTLFNSGLIHSQLSSCYITTIDDSLDRIFIAMKDNALLSKWAGGLGNDWSQIRALGSIIQGTKGISQGVIPFMKVANDTAVAVNQGGKRKGATCAYLETWHLDIEEFLELRKNTGDERRRTHDMNTANWVPDLFMERVVNKQQWTLFSPSDVPDLHDLYGDKFRSRYEFYEEQTKNGKINHFKTIDAIVLWRKMLSLLFETGHPWITFKDPCNLRSPQQHVGVVHSSNLCTEITLNTNRDEIAVCNLGSLNLANHLVNGELDKEKVKKTVKTAIRFLDNVIDVNFYPVKTAENSNLKHRPVGLGIMGFQDCLYMMNIPYTSQQAVSFADKSSELISYFAIEASTKLAIERGKYSSYKGSLWYKGILPIDSWKNFTKYRKQYINSDTDLFSTLDWDTLRQKVLTNGMRNSNLLAIAPTATIANIIGVTQSIEPMYQNLFVKSNLSGEFTIINKYLVEKLRKIKLWDQKMVNDLKYYNGSLEKISTIPNDIKEIFQTAFEIDAEWLIKCASKRQKWLDQAQSLNLYISHPSGKKIDAIYKHAWLYGLKTTYYLRALSATMTEKVTIDKDDALQQVSKSIDK